MLGFIYLCVPVFNLTNRDGLDGEVQWVTSWKNQYSSLSLSADAEFDNLWDDPAHTKVRADLTERLLLTEIEHIDRLPLPTRRA